MISEERIILNKFNNIVISELEGNLQIWSKFYCLPKVHKAANLYNQSFQL